MSSILIHTIFVAIQIILVTTPAIATNAQPSQQPVQTHNSQNLVEVQDNLDSTQDNSDNSTVWEFILYLEDELPAIKETITKLEVAPTEGGIFTRNKKDYQEDLNESLDDAMRILFPDIFESTREKLQSIDRKENELTQEKIKMELEKEHSPSRYIDITGFKDIMANFGRLGIQKINNYLYQKELQGIESKLVELSMKRKILIDEFRETVMDRYGVELNENQTESLLYQVNGSDLVETIAIANILTEVEKFISDIIAKPAGTVTSELRLQYYGFALIVRLIIERLHSRHLANYDNFYLPRLARLEKISQVEINKNSELLKILKNDENHISAVESNDRILRMTISAIHNYRNVLMNRRDKVQRMQHEAYKNSLVAQSTLSTLETVLNFDQIASKTFEEFIALAQLETNSDLLPLDDQELYAQYLDISKKLLETEI